MKTILTAILLFVSINVFAQTTLSAGVGGAYEFAKGEQKSSFKTIIISQVNQVFGNVVLSAVTVGVDDSVATGYIGTGLSFAFAQNKEATRQFFLGANILKGQKKDALLGAGLSMREKETVIGLHIQNDLVTGEKWAVLTFQRILF